MNIITKDTHEINFTENNEYKDFHIELNEEKEKEIEKIARCRRPARTWVRRRNDD